jgi:type I restriction enzyme S subunit
MKWENYRLKQISNYWTGKVDASVLDATSYVSTENLIPEKGGVVNSSYVPLSGRANSYSTNDVLISNIRPYFKKIWLADKDGGCSNDVLVFRAKLGLEPVYLYYQLSKDAFFDYMVAGSNGTKMPRGNKTSIMEYLIPLPPLPTQRKIAGILSAYDDLIENNLKRIKLLEEAAQVSYKKIINGEYKVQKTPLSQLATVTSSKRIFLSDYVEEGIPFYRSKEIIAKSNFEAIENPLYITEEKYSDIKEKFGVPVNGDLLITSVGTIGYIHLVNDDDGNFYFKDGNLIWIRNLVNPYLMYFLFFKFRTLEFRNMLNSIAIGSSQKALTIETVKKIEVEIPEEDDLLEFNETCKSIIKFIYNLQKQNSKLREARDILLPRLMNGEIEV